MTSIISRLTTKPESIDIFFVRGLLTFCIYRDFFCCCIADAAAATYAATTAEAALQGFGIDITVAQTN